MSTEQLYCVYLNDAGDEVEAIDDNSSSGECGGTGGYWIDGEYGGGSWVSIDVNSGLVSGLGYDSNGNPEWSNAGAMGSNPWGSWTQSWGTALAETQGSLFSISIWDFFKNPVSGTVLVPLVDFGPFSSAGAGPTVAFNPRTDTGCLGLAAGARAPAAGRAAAIGPLPLGNLSNADKILAGGSVFAGAQSLNPALGFQAMGNGSGILGGPTFGTPGITAGVSYSGCKAGIGKKLLNWLISYAF